MVKTFSLKTDGKTKLSKNFAINEFRSKDGADEVLIDVDFVVNFLQNIRDHFGVPVTINSAYRSPKHNAAVGGAKNSFHVKGMAFDISIVGKTPQEVAKYAQSLNIPGIIQYNGFVHVDSRPVKYWARNNNGKVTTKSSF